LRVSRSLNLLSQGAAVPGQLLSVMFRSVIAPRTTPIGVWIEALPDFVLVLKVARTLRSAASWLNEKVQPD